MTRAYFATLTAALLLAAVSWHPVPHVPGWYVEACAEVAVC